jgi:hypothetical protein
MLLLRLPLLLHQLLLLCCSSAWRWRQLCPRTLLLPLLRLVGGPWQRQHAVRPRRLPACSSRRRRMRLLFVAR